MQKESKKTPHFEEWEVRQLHSREKGTNKLLVRYEKIKLLRPKVKITKNEADVLNHGVSTFAENRFHSLYLKPDMPNEFDYQALEIGELTPGVGQD